MENENNVCLAPGVNTGVRLDPLSPTDWIAGGESGAKRTVLELSGQYDLSLPDEETQAIFSLDVLACVSFSALNDLEVLFTYKLAHGLFSQRQVDFLKAEGYIDPLTGKVNFSDRYTAKMSGTTKNGNSLEAVADSIRTLHGLVPEKEYKAPSTMADETDPSKRWDLYYSPVPQALIEKGQRFLKHFLIQREWVVLSGITQNPIEAIKTALQYGPVQIAAAVCSPWGSNEGMPPIPACGCTTQHATIIYGFQDLEFWKDFDHYKSYKKNLAWNYCLPYALQYHVSEIPEVTEPEKFSYTFSKQLTFGMIAYAEVLKLQEALQYLKDPSTGKPYMKPGVFGPFGPQTRTALGAFQTAHGIKDPNGQGTNFGPKTRAAMNADLLK